MEDAIMDLKKRPGIYVLLMLLCALMGFKPFTSEIPSAGEVMHEVRELRKDVEKVPENSTAIALINQRLDKLEQTVRDDQEASKQERKEILQEIKELRRESSNGKR